MAEASNTYLLEDYIFSNRRECCGKNPVISEKLLTTFWQHRVYRPIVYVVMLGVQA